MMQYPRLSRLESIVRDVSEQMKLLHEASALLQRPGMTGRYLRSNKLHEIVDGGLHEFVPFDCGHVREKLVQWYDYWAAHNQEGYKGRIYSSAADVQPSESLVLRLAMANIKRRRQLRYWLRHPDAPESTPVVVNIEPKVESQLPPLPSTPVIDDNTAAEVHTKAPAPSQTARTATTRVSFSTAVISDMNIAHEDETALTQYEESVVGHFMSTRVPSVPRASRTSEEFECPYCGLQLNSALMKKKRAWKYATTIIPKLINRFADRHCKREHVFRDLRPYVCTFPQCSSAARLYHARHDWIHHESQMHRRQWICSNGCHQSFPSQKSFTKHLRENHQDHVTETQLPLALALSERPISDDTIDRCSLCPTNLPLTELYPHIAQHLEQLSLFVLPSSVDDSEDPGYGSNASQQAHEDVSNRFDDFSENSSTPGTRDPEVANQTVDPSEDDNGSVIMTDLANCPPTPQDPQDWAKILLNTQTSTQPADTDPVLLELQKKQKTTVQAEHTKDQAKTAMTNEDAAGFRNIIELEEYMDDHMASSNFCGYSQQYLPRPAFETVTRQAVIRFVLDSDKDLFLSEDERRDLSYRIYNECQKLFATCLYSEAPLTLLKELMDRRLSDAQFPLDAKNQPQWSHRRLWRRFIRNQRNFHTVYFELGSYQILDNRCVIPINCDDPHHLGGGSFDEVYEVQINPDQHEFPQVSSYMRDEAIDLVLKRSRKISLSRCASTVTRTSTIKISFESCCKQRTHTLFNTSRLLSYRLLCICCTK